MQSVYAARARHSALRRYRPEDDPVVVFAKSELRWAKLAAAIQREAEADPPLTPEQRARLAVLLAPSRSGGKAA